MASPLVIGTLVRFIGTCAVGLLASGAAADEKTLAALLPSLQQGGYVIVLRHGPTDPAQQDLYPLSYDEMSRQRQLSAQGKELARQTGAALEALAIPLGKVFTSHLNRAMETGRLVSGRDVTWNDALNDSGMGSAAAMTGASSAAGSRYAIVLQQLAGTRPQFHTNTLIVTHKTNMQDAFGSRFADIKEGECLLFRPDGSGGSTPIARIEAGDWIALARVR